MAKILRNALAMIAQTFCILIQKKQTPGHTKLYCCYEKPFTINLWLTITVDTIQRKSFYKF